MPEDGVQIIVASTTEIPCYRVLQELGYEVVLRGAYETAHKQVRVWEASKGAICLTSHHGLCALLGIAMVAERHGKHFLASREEAEAFIARYWGDT